jgi:Glycosyl transferases group 1
MSNVPGLARRLVRPRALTLARRPATWQALLTQGAWALREPSEPRSPHQSHFGSVAVCWPLDYASEDAAHFTAPILSALARLASVERRPLSQLYPGLVVFELSGTDGRSHAVAIDYRDALEIDGAAYEAVDLYFKLQHAREGYGLERVVPGGYVAAKSPLYHNVRRLRGLRTLPARHQVYGRFGLRAAGELRSRALVALRADPRFEFVGGPSLSLYMQSLLEAARSRICIDLPGNGPFCYRLTEYLAIGCCIIGPRHRATLPAPLRDRVEIVYCAEDLSDLADLCAHYLHNDAERESIAASAGRYFDCHLAPLRLGEHYLSTCAERLEGLI